MNFGRLWKIAAIAVIGIVILTYGTYAMSYQCNYNVDVSFILSVPEMGEVEITEFEYESEPTDVMSFWELRGKSGAPINSEYMVYAELNQSGTLSTVVVPVPVTDVPLSDSVDRTDVSFTFFNVGSGEASIRLYIEWTYISSIIYDKTYAVVIG
jgi:hypothetical protein